MENTEKVLFEDDQPQWYVALGDRWIGPITASDVYERVVAQKITWAHFVWKPGQAEWKRLCDVKTFSAAVPSQPSKSLQREVKETSQEIQRPVVKQAAAKRSESPATSKGAAVKATAERAKAPEASADEKGWFLYYNETQFGPFTKDEVIRFLTVGKINPRVHAWRTGLANWTRIAELESFKSVVAGLKPAAAAKMEMRSKPRRPMVAKILLANEREVSDAICRDISVGGMQVLTDQIPGQVGKTVKLNVSAASISPFVAEGVIVRLLEDQKGFSFRFEKLSDQAKRSIEDYIRSPQ
jgi:hypothetical protein